MLDARRGKLRGAWLALASLAALAVAGCDEAAPTSIDGGRDSGVDARPACTTLISAPGDGLISVWPDRELLVDDPSTLTGVRLHVEESAYPTLFAALAGYRDTILIDLAEVDGFGINAEAFFQFDRNFDLTMLPAPESTSLPATGIGFVVLEPGPPRIEPVIVTTTDGDATLLLAPMHPLPPRGTVAAYVTRALTAAAWGCLEPSSAQATALASPDAIDAMAISALTDLGVISAPTDLVALTTFPTQSVIEEGVAIADDIAARSFDWAPGGLPVCTTETLWDRCEGRMLVGDYRDPADGVIRVPPGTTAAPRSEYEVPVTVYLPLGRTGPMPVMIYGHGLTGDRHQAGRLAEFAAPAGMVTVAIDAAEHGEHPTVEDTSRSSLDTLFDFFGINLGGARALEAARLRDNFAGSAFDRLQLASLLRAHPDIDGDGTDDVGAALMYLGVSLGGIMGPQQIALDGDVEAGVLVVPGGRVSTIISDSSTFAPLIEAVRPRGTTEGDVRRFFPIMQTILERGDPASWAPYVLAGRLPGVAGVPDILCGVVLDDEIVPNVANYALGRALGVPIAGTLLRDEPGFELLPVPLSGNVTLGAETATAGLLQFDVIGAGTGGTEVATHGNVGDSDVGAEAWFHFIDTHLAGAAEVADPYAALGVPHAP